MVVVVVVVVVCVCPMVHSTFPKTESPYGRSIDGWIDRWINR
jgi:hypothetical protein